MQAVYFLISNGRCFALYATHSAFQGPLLQFNYEDLADRFDELAAYLFPAALARQYTNHLLGQGKPLGPGLRALHRIASGSIDHGASSLALPLLSQMQVSIVDGTLMRDEAGRLPHLH